MHGNRETTKGANERDSKKVRPGDDDVGKGNAIPLWKAGITEMMGK
jgi:hypothetical protein